MLAATRQDAPWRLLVPSIFHPIHHSFTTFPPSLFTLMLPGSYFGSPHSNLKKGMEYCDCNFVWFSSVPPNNPRLAKGSLYKMWGHGFDPWDIHSWPKCQPCFKAYFTNRLSYFWGPHCLNSWNRNVQMEASLSLLNPTVLTVDTKHLFITGTIVLKPSPKHGLSGSHFRRYTDTKYEDPSH